VIISDSSPLICISKIGQLGIVQKLYSQVLIPDSVHYEVVVQGRRLRKAGVEVIESAIQSGWIKVTALTQDDLDNVEKFKTGGEIGKGEAEAITLAMRLGLPLILDDKYARALANILGLEFQGTVAVILEAYTRGLLNKNEFIVSLRELGKVMWLSPEVMVEVLRLAEEVER
jgi:predicted nucleic acid-binding protein